MGVEELFTGHGTLSGTSNDAHSPRDFSFTFTPSVDCTLTGLGICCVGPTVPATVTAALYEPSVSTSTPVVSGSGSPSGVGDFLVAFSQPLTAGHTYRAVSGISLSGGSAQPDYGWIDTGLASDVTTAHLTAHAHSQVFENDIAGGAPYPTNTGAPDFNFLTLVRVNVSTTVTGSGSAAAQTSTTAHPVVRTGAGGTSAASSTTAASSKVIVPATGSAGARTTSAVHNSVDLPAAKSATRGGPPTLVASSSGPVLVATSGV